MSRLSTSTFHISGRNNDIDSAAAEDIWSKSGAWTPPTAARLHTLVSSSASDTGTGGAGAKTVTIYGLDSNWDLASESMTLNGASDVTTSSQYWRIHAIEVATLSDSVTANVGNLTLTAATDASVTNYIAAGDNRSTSAFFTTPTDTVGELLGFWATATGNAAAQVQVELWTRTNGEPWTVRHTATISHNGSFNHKFVVPQAIPPKTDVKLKASTSTDDSEVHGGFEVALPAGFASNE